MSWPRRIAEVLRETSSCWIGRVKKLSHGKESMRRYYTCIRQHIHVKLYLVYGKKKVKKKKRKKIEELKWRGKRKTKKRSPATP